MNNAMIDLNDPNARALQRELAETERRAAAWCDEHWHKAGEIATRAEMEKRRRMFDAFMRQHGW